MNISQTIKSNSKVARTIVQLYNCFAATTVLFLGRHSSAHDRSPYRSKLFKILVAKSSPCCNLRNLNLLSSNLTLLSRQVFYIVHKLQLGTDDQSITSNRCFKRQCSGLCLRSQKWSLRS